MKLDKTPAALTVMSWLMITGCTARPIIISESDVRAVFTPGATTIRLLWDSTGRPVDVGRTGGPNTYDFRELDFRLYDSVSVLAATRIPQLASRFPADAVTSNEEGNTLYPVFSFSNHTFLRHGRARIADTTEWYQHIVPPDAWLRFPVTFNTQFTSAKMVVVDTTYVNGLPTKTSADTSSHMAYVDGWGTLLLPGGVALKCLRLRQVGLPPGTSQSFQYWTREGTVILIDSDQTQPDTGVIKRGYVIYFSPQTLDRTPRR